MLRYTKYHYKVYLMVDNDDKKGIELHPIEFDHYKSQIILTKIINLKENNKIREAPFDEIIAHNRQYTIMFFDGVTCKNLLSVITLLGNPTYFPCEDNLCEADFKVFNY